MTRKLAAAELRAHAAIVPPPAQRACEDRTFELPPILHLATAGLFLAFIGVMAAGFRHPEMVVPVAVFVAFIVAFFAVPALWVRMKPDNASRALGWAEFREMGIDTATGRCASRDAIAQVLILPVLIFGWGIAVVTIAAIV